MSHKGWMHLRLWRYPGASRRARLIHCLRTWRGKRLGRAVHRAKRKAFTRMEAR